MSDRLGRLVVIFIREKAGSGPSTAIKLSACDSIGSASIELKKRRSQKTGVVLSAENRGRLGVVLEEGLKSKMDSDRMGREART